MKYYALYSLHSSSFQYSDTFIFKFSSQKHCQEIHVILADTCCAINCLLHIQSQVGNYNAKKHIELTTCAHCTRVLSA